MQDLCRACKGQGSIQGSPTHRGGHQHLSGVAIGTHWLGRTFGTHWGWPPDPSGWPPAPPGAVLGQWDPTCSEALEGVRQETAMASQQLFFYLFRIHWKSDSVLK